VPPLRTLSRHQASLPRHSLFSIIIHFPSSPYLHPSLPLIFLITRPSLSIYPRLRTTRHPSSPLFHKYALFLSPFPFIFSPPTTTSFSSLMNKHMGRALTAVCPTKGCSTKEECICPPALCHCLHQASLPGHMLLFSIIIHFRPSPYTQSLPLIPSPFPPIITLHFPHHHSPFFPSSRMQITRPSLSIFPRMRITRHPSSPLSRETKSDEGTGLREAQAHLKDLRVRRDPLRSQLA